MRLFQLSKKTRAKIFLKISPKVLHDKTKEIFTARADTVADTNVALKRNKKVLEALFKNR